MRRVIILINIFILMSLVACNGINDKNQDIIVDQAWARPAYQGNPSAVYFKIQNYLDEADRLVSVESHVAEVNEIHLSSMVNGTMKMMKQDFVEIKPDQVLEFKPKSYHIMLINLKQDLKVGDKFDISLTFEKAGQKVMSVEVKESE